MKDTFEEAGQLGYMGHNGGLQIRRKSDFEFEYTAPVQAYHLNSGGITHGGFLMTLMDSGIGTAIYKFLGPDKRIATIDLDVKFIAPSYQGDTIVGTARIIKKTRSMVFARGELCVGKQIIATADGIWKILGA